MSLWINSSILERRQMLQQVATRMHFADCAAEKDWWVSLVLKAVFSLPTKEHMLFKGGTSLSKGWSLISRFSEDIDLTLSRAFFVNEKQLSCAACANNQQVKLLRKASRDYITSEFCPALERQIRQFGVHDFRLSPVQTRMRPDGEQVAIDHDSDPTELVLEYTSIVEKRNAYVLPTVRIEISCLGMDEPFEIREISSLVFDSLPEEDSEMRMSVPTVLPTRTFLEKAFLLNEEFQRANPRSLRMSRHLYDLERLMDTTFATDALRDKDLYTSVINHRKRFYHVGGVDYSTDMPMSINFVPQGEMMSMYKSDYINMLHTHIYDRTTAMPYERLLQRMEELRQRFRDCQWSKALE